VDALDLRAQAAGEAPVHAAAHAVARDVLLLALRHVGGRHVHVVALGVVLGVARSLGPGAALGVGHPFAARGQLLAAAGVALAWVGVGPHAEAGVVHHVARQGQAPVFGAAAQVEARMAVVGAGAAAVVVLAAVAAQVQRRRAAEARRRAPRDDVHHATHGGAAVLRRAGPLDHLDAFHVAQQVLAQVHGGAGAGGDRQAVDQHQHLVGAQALQRQLVARLAQHLAQLQAGHVLQRLLERARMRALDFLARDHLGAHGGVIQRALGARGRDDRGLEGVFGVGFLRMDGQGGQQGGKKPERRAGRQRLHGMKAKWV